MLYYTARENNTEMYQQLTTEILILGGYKKHSDLGNGCSNLKK